MQDLIQDIMPEGWLEDVRMDFGETLTDDMIVQSVSQASDFFNMEDPMAIAEDWTTGVYPNSDMTPLDDILVFNREQLEGMGITGQDGLNLVMTHECAHRVLQGIDWGFDSHQEELCCDFMAGVRAGLNGIDVSQMEDSLSGIFASETHPAGWERVEAIEAGVEFANEYYQEHGIAPTFSECLEHFTEDFDQKYFEIEDPLNLRLEEFSDDFKEHMDETSIRENQEGLFGDNIEVDNSLNNGYNVSFRSQYETIESQGGKTLKVTIEKEPGSSNLYSIKSSKGIIHNVKGSTKWIEIDHIKYKLPKLKG